jgi:hypothetical protein
MIRKALLAAVVATLTLTACGDDSPSAEAAPPAAGDTVAGCLDAVKKSMESASETGDPGALDDDPPPECDDLSAEDQQKAMQQAVQESLGELSKELEKLDPATRKEVEDALKGNG